MTCSWNKAVIDSIRPLHICTTEYSLVTLKYPTDSWDLKSVFTCIWKTLFSSRGKNYFISVSNRIIPFIMFCMSYYRTRNNVIKMLPVVLNVGHNFKYCDNTAILYYRRTEVMMLDHTKGPYVYFVVLLHVELTIEMFGNFFCVFIDV